MQAVIETTLANIAKEFQPYESSQTPLGSNYIFLRYAMSYHILYKIDS